MSSGAPHHQCRGGVRDPVLVVPPGQSELPPLFREQFFSLEYTTGAMRLFSEGPAAVGPKVSRVLDCLKARSLIICSATSLPTGVRLLFLLTGC